MMIDGILPSKSELSRFSREHPIVTIVGAITVVSAANTLVKALTAPRGSSPYATSYELEGISHMGIAAEGPEAWLKHEKSSSLAHLSKAQEEKLDKVSKELKAASKMHSSQADRLKQLGNPPKGMQFFAHLSKSQTEELEKIQSELNSLGRVARLCFLGGNDCRMLAACGRVGRVAPLSL